jgi:hypothetical protein
MQNWSYIVHSNSCRETGWKDANWIQLCVHMVEWQAFVMMEMSIWFAQVLDIFWSVGVVSCLVPDPALRLSPFQYGQPSPVHSSGSFPYFPSLPTAAPAPPRIYPVHERLWLSQQRMQEIQRRRLDAHSMHLQR